MQLEIIDKDLPENILFIYTTICQKKYGIINESLPIKDKQLIETACHFLHDNDSKNRVIDKNFVVPKEQAILFEKYLADKVVLKNEMYEFAKKKILLLKEGKTA